MEYTNNRFYINGQLVGNAWLRGDQYYLSAHLELSADDLTLITAKLIELNKELSNEHSKT